MKREQMMAIFLLAGLRVDRADELANQYWPNVPEYFGVRAQMPWWLVHTELGSITIGWRKRVISIDWERTEYRGVVTNDNVTKDETMVHAYSYAKAVEYLNALIDVSRAAKYAAKMGETRHD